MSVRRKSTVPLVLLALFLFSQTLFAQGLLVNETAVAVWLPRPMPPRPIPQPRPVASYSIKSLNIDARIDGQIAKVDVAQTFTNTGSTQMEVSFVFPLPYDGAIDSMTLLVDGKEFPAKLLDAKEARKTYEEIVRRNQDPALLEWIGYGMFKTSVFPVPAGASRTVQLRYTQLLKADGGLTDFLYPLSAAKYTTKPVEKLEINVNIESPDEIKNIYSPTHGVEIKRPSSNRATISFDATNTIPANDFRLLYDTGKGEIGTRVLSFRPDEKDDGYFMLLASPRFGQTEQKFVPKTVIFVLDHSGSMSGKKIEQARDALKFVLNNLHEGDTFNIVPYSGDVEKFKPEIQPLNTTTRKEALDFTEAIRASGSTNIDAALRASLGMIQDRKTPSYVLFLTDGCPTVGEMNEMKLAEIAKNANQYGARIFAFGVGFDVNSRLLDRFARDGRGQTEFVKPDENIEERVARLYHRIASPVLTDVSFSFKNKGSDASSYGTNRIYPSGVFDLFTGEQLVVVGRYSKPGDVEIVVKGLVGEAAKEFKFDGNFVANSTDRTLGFIPRLWAMRRIGEILDQLDLKGQNKELVDELVQLSTKYGILTPYTSFLADENTVLTDRASNVRVTESNTHYLGRYEGESGVRQRAAKGKFQAAMQADSSSLQTDVQDAELAMALPAASSSMGAAGRRPVSGPFGSPGATTGLGGGVNAYSAPAKQAVESRQDNVQTINNRAFFQKGGVWIDSTLTEAQQKPENIVTVKQFSEEYFMLIEKYGNELSPYLALEGTQLVNLAGKAYRFEP